jgi:hypothetical protein
MNAPPTKQPFNSPASQEERSRILQEQARVIAEQEARSAGTRSAYNNIVDPLPSGRWSKPSRGNDPAQLYPILPASSPWHHDPVPNEEPFGVDINYVEPCGTHEEIARSLSVAASSSSAAVLYSSPSAATADPFPSIRGSADLAGSSQATTSVAPGVAERVASPPSFPKRRKLT